MRETELLAWPSGAVCVRTLSLDSCLRDHFLLLWHKLPLQGADIGLCCWLSWEPVRLFFRPIDELEGHAVSISALNEKRRKA